MTNPVIAPSTLTDEQREEIKEEYANMGVVAMNAILNDERMAALYAQKTLVWLFGKELFEQKG